MEDNIFVLDRDGNLREMQRSGFETEDIFQALLAKHPTLLRKAAGTDGRLLLITREQGVPEEMGGYGRWSLDHLFVDTEGVPVFVEVKRAEDTRARREVVAQMLDYAANGVAYWQIGGLISAYETSASEDGKNPDEELLSFIDATEGVDGAVEAFWKRVETNLQAGRVRLLFVADKISKELARIVEFLNEQMRSAEVLALELEHYNDGSEVRTIVPRLIGATERAETAKAASPDRKPVMTIEDGLVEMARLFGGDFKAGAVKAINWFQARGFHVAQTSAGAAACVLVPKADGGTFWPFFIRWNTGRFEVSVSYLRKIPYYAETENRQSLIDSMIGRLGSSNLKLPAKATEGWPSISTTDLLKPEVWSGFVEIASEIIAHIQKKE
jgi:hypothetical protein